MKSFLILLALIFTENRSFAAGPFETGCVKAATEVLCLGHRDCAMGFIMTSSKQGNDNESGGYTECKEFAKYVKAQSLPLDAKKAIARLQTKIANFNYLNDLKSTLYNVGKDAAGKQAMKAKFQQIKLGFYSHNASARSPEIKIVDKVLIVPGVFTIDNNMYAGEVQKFLETKL